MQCGQIHGSKTTWCAHNVRFSPSRDESCQKESPLLVLIKKIKKRDKALKALSFGDVQHNEIGDNLESTNQSQT